MRTKLNDALSGVMPPQRILISSGERKRYIELSPVAQLSISTGIVLSLGWMAVASAALVLNVISADSSANQTLVLQEAYQERIDELTYERDQRTHEARSAQARFSTALDQISLQQSELLASIEEQHELKMGLELMRVRLDAALDQRDAVREDYATLSRELDAISGSLDTRRNGEEDLADTVEAITDALGSAVRTRDTAKAEREEMALELAGLELRMQVNAERQDRMVAQLEEAVAVSFEPLEQMFKNSGMDVDSIVSSVRRNYSGVGGPLTASVSQRSFDDPELNERFSALMEGMDRMNLMRIAAAKVPYSMPVTVSHRFTSGFGTRRDPKTGGRRAHNGIDLAGPRGTHIKSTAEGVVVFAGRQSGFGKMIKIRHEFGFETLYAHLNKIHVSVGDRVSRGDHIGDMGTTGRSTGVHLHYEIRIGGKPVNPMTYIKAANDVF